ncbi:MAG: hypothetical protein FD161_3001 [Limisphaerales bacterium]|nr:MAG: hypothetical protein FD161_3001 [Limisphaerales bacterium]KAG0508114.1 MAG: hypothetical protein E1N63_2708 [Limisphaerales bacterium]TXT53033.1 MAG: hypothetical protein FD140_141 [Limisphaerales bacterium]
MSNVMPMMHRIRARNRAKLQARLVKQRLACPCGGTKDHEKMIVCLECFRAAPLDLQRDAYSRSPEVRRTAARQLLARAKSKHAERQLNPGGELTTETLVKAPGLQAESPLLRAPAPAGVTSKAAPQRAPAAKIARFALTLTGECKGCGCRIHQSDAFCGECLCEEDGL